MRLIKKLKTKQGESIAEVLSAILVMALAMTAFGVGMSTAFRLNKKAQDLDRQYRSEYAEAECFLGSTPGAITAGTITEGAITVSGAGVTVKTVEVYFSTTDSALRSYVLR